MERSSGILRKAQSPPDSPMKKSITTLLAFLLLTALAATASAQDTGREHLAELQKLGAESGDLETFRREFATFYADVMKLSGQVVAESPARSLNPAARGDLEKQTTVGMWMIESMAPEDLALLRWAYDSQPRLRSLAQKLTASFTPETQRLFLVARARYDAGMADPARARLLEAAAVSCPNLRSDVLITVSTIAQQAASVAEAAMQLLAEDAFTSVPYAVLAGVWGALNIVAVTADGVYALDDNCQNSKFEEDVNSKLDSLRTALQSANDALKVLTDKAGEIDGKLDALEAQVRKVDENVSTRATQTSVNTLQATANIINGKLDALSQQIAAFQEENLILQIELNLLGGPRYNNVKFQLPKSQGGFLEKVGEIVQNRINESRAAGLPASPGAVAQAQEAWNAGANFLNFNGYKDAYASFRTAYLLLSVVPANKQP